ncbi:hypothetical protein [Ruminococcus flavefaciens]|uniref:hypothetical protein n=1 Tax=Ruminococcus flavefaciens TaxID=1265 RepID=UPI0004659D66|nr:hypothetical protein [Ruminococcus flavefaciens]
MENEEMHEETGEDTTEALMESYDRKRRNRADDIIATQAVICILIGVLFFAGNMLYPDITGAIFQKLRGLVTEDKNIIPNPIDHILNYIDKL